MTNYGTVIATGSHPFPPTSQYSAVLIDGTGSVANSGIIRANANNSFDLAIRLNNGGNVSNSASGTIAGDGTAITSWARPGPPATPVDQRRHLNGGKGGISRPADSRQHRHRDIDPQRPLRSTLARPAR